MKRIAVQLDADGERYLLPVLDKVRQLAVNDRGMLLTGIEIYPPRGSKATAHVSAEVVMHAAWFQRQVSEFVHPAP